MPRLKIVPDPRFPETWLHRKRYELVVVITIVILTTITVLR